MHVTTRSRNPFARKRLIAAAAAATLVLAACGDDGDDDAAETATAAETDEASAATAAPAAATTAAENDRLYPEATGATTGAATDATDAPAASGEGVIALADSGLGQIVVAADGMTMYMFMPDDMGAPTCTDACAEAWPPLLVDDPSALAVGDGIDASLLATAEHPAGGTQVTYGGWPLYYFAGDAAPGDTNGQGSGGVWFALDPAGQPIP